MVRILGDNNEFQRSKSDHPNFYFQDEEGVVNAVAHCSTKAKGSTDRVATWQAMFRATKEAKEKLRESQKDEEISELRRDREKERQWQHQVCSSARRQ